MSRDTKHSCNGPGCEKVFFGWVLEPGWIEGGLWSFGHGTARIEILVRPADEQESGSYDPDEALDWCSEACLVAFLRNALAQGGRLPDAAGKSKDGGRKENPA